MEHCDNTILIFICRLKYTDIVILSVICVMIFLATLFLILSTLSSKPRCEVVFGTSFKNNCARALNFSVSASHNIF